MFLLFALDHGCQARQQEQSKRGHGHAGTDFAGRREIVPGNLTRATVTAAVAIAGPRRGAVGPGSVTTRGTRDGQRRAHGRVSKAEFDIQFSRFQCVEIGWSERDHNAAGECGIIGRVQRRAIDTNAQELGQIRVDDKSCAFRTALGPGAIGALRDLIGIRHQHRDCLCPHQVSANRAFAVLAAGGCFGRFYIDDPVAELVIITPARIAAFTDTPMTIRVGRPFVRVRVFMRRPCSRDRLCIEEFSTNCTFLVLAAIGICRGPLIDNPIAGYMLMIGRDGLFFSMRAITAGSTSQPILRCGCRHVDGPCTKIVGFKIIGGATVAHIPVFIFVEEVVVKHAATLVTAAAAAANVSAVFAQIMTFGADFDAMLALATTAAANQRATGAMTATVLTNIGTVFAKVAGVTHLSTDIAMVSAIHANDGTVRA